MKLTVIVMSLVLSASAFSATVLNGVTLSNLPTASKTYEKKFEYGSAIDHLLAKTKMREECLKDKADAEAFITKSGSKVLASAGCAVNVNDKAFCDQGGCEGVSLATSFEVIFK